MISAAMFLEDAARGVENSIKTRAKEKAKRKGKEQKWSNMA
jgi:hypothetical protein